MKTKIAYIVAALLMPILSGCSKAPKYNFESKEALIDSVLIQAQEEGIDSFTAIAILASWPEVNEIESKATAKLLEERGSLPNSAEDGIAFTKEARKRCEPEQLKFYESKMKGKTLKQLMKERGTE